MERNARWVNRVWFSDEAHFHLNGAVNNHNNTFWGNSPPEEVTEKQLKGPKVTAFVAYNATHGLLGPYWKIPVTDNVFWYREAEGELEEALNNEPNRNQAKNIIVFIGDGMGIPTITAARIYKGQQQGKNGEEGHLYFEKFPHVALSKVS
ncbi:Alkaline phosphatase [Amphibalanus amphitrite]|uniref:alkaline phosphatase n=1 Tax=Amphibalanus amphitrite TaxID=1232801 RepID=A0A6A4WY27_AMPAM|nr:Alkaline phosphatase [Amphibalanus amphitrite]